jgi:hypothetical protein
MKLKLLLSTLSLGGLAGLALLAAPQAHAAVPLAPAQVRLAQAQTTPTASPKTTPSTSPNGRRGHGHGPGGPGIGRGPGGDHGRHGGAYTADGASRVISATNSLITLVKSDLAYANGKMNTGTVQDWLNKADGLVGTARSASGSGQYGQAVETAGAAADLARAADLLMQQALGAANLPSASQRPFPGRGGVGPGSATGVTQARASRELAGLYNSIVRQEALLSSAGSAANASTYLAAAKDYYRTAYTAYQGGKYDEAYGSAAVARTLLEVTNHLMRATTAPNSPDAPVQVPAPNF